MKFTFAPEATPLAGYTIKRAIDRGGFGEVYYALSDSGKEVALKLLQRNQQVELRGVRQCLNLKHPNLVAIFDIRTDADEDHWVVMEYVAGKSLEQVLDEHPKGLPVPEIEQWISGIAAGIGFLHDRGIVHRDLKPANVFREAGVVKIGDVGLSKFITPSRRSAQTESVGTVYYMAPEVARGKYGSELDVYSLGVILFEMLTGQVPFNGESTGEILMKHLTEPPDLMKVAPPFRPVLARALEKDPQRRTPGALQLLDDFRRALRGKPIAEEIPASHFVDVERLEQQVARESRFASTQAPAGNGAAAANGRKNEPFPQPSHGRAGGAPHERADAVSPAGWPFLRQELGRNRWLLAAVIVLLLHISPLIAHRGFTRGNVLLGMALPFSFAYVTYWFATNYRQITDRRRGPAGATAGEIRWSPWCAGSKHANRAQPVSAPPAVNRPPVERAAPAAPIVPVGKGAEKPVAPKPDVEVFSPNTPRARALRSRLADLSTSMTLAVAWSIAATALLGTMTKSWPQLGMSNQHLAEPARAMVFGLTTIFGAWAIQVLSRLVEGAGPETTARRLVLTASGAGVGACAWWLSQVLFVEIPFKSAFPGLFNHAFQYPLVSGAHVPTLAGFMTFFAALFALRRWWWQSDSFRHNRFRIRSWLWSGVVAFFIPALFMFPQPWGVCWALAISAVVQLSSPWVHPQERSALVQAKSREASLN